MITISELKSGLIFGDNESGEYVYMPASEIGIDSNFVKDGHHYRLGSKQNHANTPPLYLST